MGMLAARFVDQDLVERYLLRHPLVDLSHHVVEGRDGRCNGSVEFRFNQLLKLGCRPKERLVLFENSLGVANALRQYAAHAGCLRLILLEAVFTPERLDRLLSLRKGLARASNL